MMDINKILRQFESIETTSKEDWIKKTKTLLNIVRIYDAPPEMNDDILEEVLQKAFYEAGKIRRGQLKEDKTLKP